MATGVIKNGHVVSTGTISGTRCNWSYTKCGQVVILYFFGQLKSSLAGWGSEEEISSSKLPFRRVGSASGLLWAQTSGTCLLLYGTTTGGGFTLTNKSSGSVSGWAMGSVTYITDE